jgi:choline dehydrogenase-like flavoprotein
MVSLRFRPEWFRARNLLGYGADWPIDCREMWLYYTEVEQALKIAWPVSYPWGPKRPRYPYRAHELNAAALALAEGCENLGIAWNETPLATLSATRGLAHPCVYRGFCVTGCSTNAKQSALVTWIPHAVAAGAETLTSPWPAGSRSMRPGAPLGCIIIVKARGVPATWWSRAIRLKRRNCC